jgi:ParB-like chromosome segregation protein Spo0J
MKKKTTKKSGKFGTKSYERRKRKAKSGSMRRGGARGGTSLPRATELKLRHYAPDEIKAESPSRPINADAVEGIADGVDAHGQFTPLTVRVIAGVPHLVTGYHRLHAAKARKLKKVPCLVIRGKDLARIWQISENLHRGGLTVLEEAEQTAEYLNLRMKLALSKDADAKERGPGRPEGLKKMAAKGLMLPGKTPAAKQKALDRRLSIAGTAPAAKQAACEAGFANSQKSLLAISRESTLKAQLAKVKVLKKGSGSPKANSTESEDDEPPLEEAKREFLKATGLLRALKRLSRLAEFRILLAFVLAFVLGKDLDDEVYSESDAALGDKQESDDDVEDSEGDDAEEGDDGHDEDGDDEGDDEDEE